MKIKYWNHFLTRDWFIWLTMFYFLIYLNSFNCSEFGLGGFIAIIIGHLAFYFQSIKLFNTN